MHVDGCIDLPDGVSKALKGVKLAPLATLSLIDFELHVFSYRVGSTSEDDHQGSYKDRRVLVSGERLVSASLVRGSNPVPSTISVASKTPSVLKGRLVLSPSSKCDHHTAS